MEANARIDDLKNRIKETKQQLSYIDGMTGPLVLGILGALTIFFGIGIFLIIGAIIWAYIRSNSQTQLKSLLFQYESELSRLEGL